MEEKEQNQNTDGMKHRGFTICSIHDRGFEPNDSSTWRNDGPRLVSIHDKKAGDE